MMAANTETIRERLLALAEIMASTTSTHIFDRAYEEHSRLLRLMETADTSKKSKPKEV